MSFLQVLIIGLFVLFAQNFVISSLAKGKLNIECYNNKNELLFKQSALSVRFISDSSSETKKCIITQGE